jgi:hypothetical protein
MKPYGTAIEISSVGATSPRSCGTAVEIPEVGAAGPAILRLGYLGRYSVPGVSAHPSHPRKKKHELCFVPLPRLPVVPAFRWLATSVVENVRWYEFII